VPQGTKTKAVVITVHGLSGAASDFWLLGERLPPQGYAVYGYELRGQGNDPDLSHRGDIESAGQWLNDLRAFDHLVRQRHPGVPVVWYGESLGTLITLHAATTHGSKPDALVLATPIAGLRMKISGAERGVLLAGSHVAPGLRLKLGDLAGMDESKIQVTSTTTHGSQMEVTPHHVPAFSLRLLREIDRLIHSNPKAAQAAKMPVLMLGSPYDVVSSPDQVQRLFFEVGSKDKRLFWYSKSYHLLLHDVQREEVVADLVKWLKLHVPVR
jgi:alpha-beta hydrolase superfamily lysophospholipase